MPQGSGTQEPAGAKRLRTAGFVLTACALLSNANVPARGDATLSGRLASDESPEGRVGAVMACAAGIGLAVGPPATGPAVTTQRVAESRPTAEPLWRPPADLPWWSRDGLVLASVEDVLADRAWRNSGGRTRKPTLHERQGCEIERSAVTLRMLHDIGVTLVIIPYGGFGPDSIEEPERRLAKETAERARQLGLHCGFWLPVGQVDPRVWADQDGDPPPVVLTPEGDAVSSADHSGRRYVSVSGVDSLARWRAVARRAAEEAGADALFLPDFHTVLGFEPEAGRLLERFLRRRYRADREADGLLGVLARDGLPRSGEGPLAGPWIECRADALHHAVHSLAAELRAVRLDALLGLDAISINMRVGRAGGPAVDPPSLLEGVDLAASALMPRTTARAEVAHQVVDFKMATARGCRAATRTLTPRSLAQQLAFGGDCAGFMAYFENGELSADPGRRQNVRPDVVALVHNYRRRRAVYAEMRPVSDVCVFWPRGARISAEAPAEVMAVQAMQALAAHRVPFGFVFDDLPRTVPPGAALLVPGLSTVTPTQADALRALAAQGVGLVVVGRTTVAARGAGEPAAELSEFLAAGSADAPAPPREVRPGVVVRETGRARIVSLAAPGPPANRRIVARAHHRARLAPPPESDEFAAAIRLALDRPLSVEGALERGSAVELTRSDDGRRTALHVVNFDEGGPLAPAEVAVRVPDAATVRQVLRFPNEGDRPEPVEFERDGGAVRFRTALVNLYEAYLIE